VRQHQKVRNGRQAWLDMVAYYTGGSFQTLRVKQAMEVIDNTYYDGRKINFSFESYRCAYGKAYLELGNAGSPMAEQQKVRKFLQNITYEPLSAAKAVVISSEVNTTNFDETSRFLAKFVAELDVKQTAKRHVSSVRGQQLKLGPYSEDEWQALSKETRAEILRRRKSQPSGSTYRRKTNKTGPTNRRSNAKLDNHDKSKSDRSTRSMKSILKRTDASDEEDSATRTDASYDEDSATSTEETGLSQKKFKFRR
jgi:hypothetical protein